MRFIFILIMVWALPLLAEVSEEVLIRGKVHNNFNDREIEVIDEFKQIIVIPRNKLPKNIKLQSGTPVSLEIDQKLLKFK